MRRVNSLLIFNSSFLFSIHIEMVSKLQTLVSGDGKRSAISLNYQQRRRLRNELSFFTVECFNRKLHYLDIKKLMRYYYWQILAFKYKIKNCSTHSIRGAG